MKLSAVLFLAFFVNSLLVSSLSAQSLSVPNLFENGDPADADEINANFEAIEAAVNANTSVLTPLRTNGEARFGDDFGTLRIVVDCSTNPAALLDALLWSVPYDPVFLDLIGICDGDNAFDRLEFFGRQLRIGSSADGGQIRTDKVSVTGSTVFFSNINFISRTGPLVFEARGASYLIHQFSTFQTPPTIRISDASSMLFDTLSDSLIALLEVSKNSSITSVNTTVDIDNLVLRLNASYECLECSNTFGQLISSLGSTFSAQQPSSLTIDSITVENGSLVAIDGPSPSDDVSVDSSSVYSTVDP